jgi:hypothetical protein
MTAPALPRRFLHLAAFVLAVLTVYTADLFAVSVLGRSAHPDLLALGVTLDLVVVVPFLVWFFLVRGRRWSPVVLVPAFLLSLVAAGRVLPADHQQTLQALKWLAIPLELFMVGLVVVKARQVVRRMRTQGPADPGMLFDRLRDAARQVLGVNFLSDALAFEIAVSHLALAGWWARPVSSPEAFTYHRRVAYGAVMGALLLVLTGETIGLHFLIQQWSPAAAWVLTALSIYSAFWLLGLYQAVRLRPIRVEEDGLLIRVGLRCQVRVPYQDIADFQVLKPGTVLPRRKGLLRAVVLGEMRYLIRLARPLTAEGPYGIRKSVEEIAFTVDEPQRFEAVLEERRSAR